MKERILSSSLVNCLPIWMNSMKSAPDIIRRTYILHFKKADEYGTGEWRDCFKTRAQNRCLASVFNSPYTCFFDIVTQRMATANCKLKVSHHRDGPNFSLQATTTINAHEEILWSYRADYEYPEKIPCIYICLSKRTVTLLN